MLRDITLGQYYPGDSFVHSLDPRAKLFAAVVYLVSMFLMHWPDGFLIAAGMLVLSCALARLPLKLMVKGIRGIWIFIVLTAVCSLFLTDGNALLSFGIIKITDTGVEHAIFYTLRLVFLVLGMSVLTLTTTPGKLTDGIDEGLGFLERFKIPVHEFAMMMSIALRFIPILAEEADKIKMAQTARGANFGEGKLIERAKGLVSILVPLFVSAFKRAEDLASAMEARCYGGNVRTRLSPLKFRAADIIVILVFLAYLVLMILLFARG